MSPQDKRERGREGETDRQTKTDRQTDRDRDRQTEKKKKKMKKKKKQQLNIQKKNHDVKVNDTFSNQRFICLPSPLLTSY